MTPGRRTVVSGEWLVQHKSHGGLWLTMVSRATEEAALDALDRFRLPDGEHRVIRAVDVEPAPIDHTAAIVQAAREYVAAIRSHEGVWPSLKTAVSIHDVVAEHVKVEHFEQQLFCGCGFRLWHPLTGFGDPSTVQQDGQTVAEAALAWHLAKKIQEVSGTVPERLVAPDVVELRCLAEAATPGPWWHEWVDGDDWWAVYGQPTGDMVCPEVCTMWGADESAYIAAANPAAVLGLLDEADALRAELAHMREARDNARAEVERLTGLVEAVREDARDIARDSGDDKGCYGVDFVTPSTGGPSRDPQTKHERTHHE